MRRLFALAVLAVCAAASAVVGFSDRAEAATYMGAGVTCYGTPTYSSQPLINCSQNGGRYASRVVKYRDANNSAYCYVYVQYGSAYKWTWGTSFVLSSFTYAGYHRC